MTGIKKSIFIPLFKTSIESPLGMGKFCNKKFFIISVILLTGIKNFNFLTDCGLNRYKK